MTRVHSFNPLHVIEVSTPAPMNTCSPDMLVT
jgi:hypothetical protein